MLYLPGFFGESFVNDWMDDFDCGFPYVEKGHKGEKPLAKNLMKTDVVEGDTAYEVQVEVPGYNKDEIQISLQKGMLVIEAKKEVNQEEKDETGKKVIRKERYVGNVSRSFYVGKNLTVEDIQAKLDQGILKLTIPKKEKQPEVPEKTLVSIEG